MKKPLLKELAKKYKRANYLPADKVLETAEYNTETLVSILYVLLFLGISGLCAMLIGGRAMSVVASCSGEKNVRHMLHLYISYSIVMIAAVKFIVQKKKRPALHNAVHYTSLAFMLFICVFTCMNSHQPVNGFLILVCVTTLVLLVFHVNPIVFAVSQTTAMIIMTPVLHDFYDGTITANTWIFTILNYPLIFSRHFNYIKKLRAAENLKSRNNMLSTRNSELKTRNTELNSEIEQQHTRTIRNLNRIIQGMASVIETRDDDTGQHIQRTSEYCRMIAEKAREKGLYSDQIDDSFIQMLEKAAPMHDIGKIAIPDNILKKPAKLTAEEFEIIKSHTTEGNRMISHIFGDLEIANQDFIDMVHDVVIGHHEKWNGEGYPYGISGEEIPLSARIMSLADVYDALISKRCYKEEFTIERAVSEIRKGCGSQFDPVLTEVFLEIINDTSRKEMQC